MYKKQSWPLTLYFDGECPLCAREIKLLRARSKADRLHFVDLSDEAFDASTVGFTHAQMVSSLHARFSDGTWVKGLDATLWSWRAAGLGIWAAPLSWRLTRPLFDKGYRLFCRWRPHLAWLPHPDGGARCRNDSCAISKAAPTPGTQSGDGSTAQTRKAQNEH